ncbi:MAG TPA: hypothetical protein ENF75_00585 [Acidilobales archaeon]|nr:hypothetical protein [Acidilobales archaeon]
MVVKVEIPFYALLTCPYKLGCLELYAIMALSRPRMEITLSNGRVSLNYESKLVSKWFSLGKLLSEESIYRKGEVIIDSIILNDMVIPILTYGGVGIVVKYNNKFITVASNVGYETCDYVVALHSLGCELKPLTHGYLVKHQDLNELLLKYLLVVRPHAVLANLIKEKFFNYLSHYIGISNYVRGLVNLIRSFAGVVPIHLGRYFLVLQVTEQGLVDNVIDSLKNIYEHTKDVLTYEVFKSRVDNVGLKVSTSST